MSFDVPEFKSKRKGGIKKEDPVLFNNEEQLAREKMVKHRYGSIFGIEVDKAEIHPSKKEEEKEENNIATIMESNADVLRCYQLESIRRLRKFPNWEQGAKRDSNIQFARFQRMTQQEQDNIKQYVKNKLPELLEDKEVYEKVKKEEKANNIENIMATDADILRYYEVTERLGLCSVINSNYWHNGRQIGYVEQQMVSFGHTSPQDKDHLRRYVKIELPKLEEQLKEKYEINKRKEKEEREALRVAQEKAKKDAEIRLKAQRESRIKAQERLNRRKEEEDFERRFKEEEKEKRYQEFKKNKSGLGLAAASNEALPVAIAVPISVPTLVVESSSFALKNKLWVSGR